MNSTLNLLVKYISILVTIAALFLCSWYVLHGDLYFFNDVARDFHLYREIDAKKIVLLGPRSSTSGLFHGPLWMYLNYPAYLLGHGNPIVVGWFWVVLIAAFLISGFFIAKRLFDANTAYLYTALMATQLVFAARGLYNPYGAFFLLPAFFYCFIRYLQTYRYPYLLAHLFLAGCIIQFEMATGVPFLLLSTIPILYFLIKQKKYLHVLCFAILAIPLSTFVLFDVRHQFLQLHAVMKYLTASNHSQTQNTLAYVGSRLKLIITPGIQVFRNDPTGMRNILALIPTGILLYFAFKEKTKRLVYGSLLYFYIGDYVLMLINRTGDILYQYYMPLSALTVLMFASLISIKKYQKAFLVIFFIILVVNLSDALTFINTSHSFIGKDLESWKFLDTMAKRLYDTKDASFGYFVYSPDVVAYQAKYAIFYEGDKSKKTAYSFEKKPITYLIIAPPPPDKPGMKDDFWKKNQLHLDKTPTNTIHFPNGYKIERYTLTQQETSIPYDPGINPGLFFR